MPAHLRPIPEPGPDGAEGIALQRLIGIERAFEPLHPDPPFIQADMIHAHPYELTDAQAMAIADQE